MSNSNVRSLKSTMQEVVKCISFKQEIKIVATCNIGNSRNDEMLKITSI